MSEQVGLTRGQQVAMLLAVSTIAGFLAGLLGILASALHASWRFDGPHVLFGTLWGAVTGILVSVFWCKRMYQRIRGGNVHRLIAYGQRLGIIAGVISAGLLHTGLYFVCDRPSSIAFITGIACGVIVGYFVGSLAAVGVQTMLPIDESVLSGENTETES